MASGPSLPHMFSFTRFQDKKENSQDSRWRHITSLIRIYCKSVFSFPHFVVTACQTPVPSGQLRHFYGKNAIPWEPFTSLPICNSSSQWHQFSFVLKPPCHRLKTVAYWRESRSASLWSNFNQLGYYTTSDLQICVVCERDSPGAILNFSSIHHGINWWLFGLKMFFRQVVIWLRVSGVVCVQQESTFPSGFCVTAMYVCVCILLTGTVRIYTRSSRCSFPHLYKSLSVIRTTQLFFGGGGVTEQTMVHLFSLSFLFLHLWCNDRFSTLQSAQVSYKTAESVRGEREGFCMCVFTLENQTGSFPAYKSSANCTHMFLCVLVCLCLSQFGSTDAHTLVRSPWRLFNIYHCIPTP